MSETVDDYGLYFEGSEDADIIIVVDPPSEANWDRAYALSDGAMKLVKYRLREIGVDPKNVAFLPCAGPLSVRDEGSDARQRDHLKRWAPEFQAMLARSAPRCIVTMGKLAARQMLQRAAQITKVRGQFQQGHGILYPIDGTANEEGIPRYNKVEVPVLPMLSPGHVLRLPANEELFEADFRMLSALIDNGYDASAPALAPSEKHYEYRFDISDILQQVEDGDITFIAEDVESTGLDWFRDEVYPLTVAFSHKEGHAIVCPVDRNYWNMHREAYEAHTGVPQPVMTGRMQQHIRSQLKKLNADPRVRKAGHNFKIDGHFLREAGMPVVNWTIDTMMYAFMVDENMPEKSLDECVRRWVPDMAGYADEFNQRTDKSRMIDVPLHDMLDYAGGDVDGTRRLARVLHPLARQDEGQWQCWAKIQMPAMGAFMDVVEPNGLPVNTDRLSDLQAQLDIRVEEEYTELISMVPPAVRRKHAEKGLRFSRADFVRDALFSKEGFNLTPIVFTKSTQKLDAHEKIASTSAKDHLPYFTDTPFVPMLMDYQRLEKMRGTYVGHPQRHIMREVKVKGSDELILVEEEEEATGFWKYAHNGLIHPSFLLHRTVTGRTASANPNAQNFPKRGRGGMKEVVKAFRRVFEAPPGWKLIEADLSQAELRVAAWMAGERTMIDLYCNGADVHAMTAARTMGLSMEQFSALDKDTRDMKRFQAKAVNFGFLYGMWWRKFMSYAKTDYGIDVSEQEAASLRETFFDLYPRLEDWHTKTKEFAREHGYVRALHGAVRHLPNIFSPDEKVQQESERQAVNSPVQRFASDLGLSALSRISRDCPRDIIKPIAFIHDAVVILAREDYAEEAGANLKFYMETPPLREWFGIEPPLPIVSDVSIGDNMADTEEQKSMEAVMPDWYDAVADDREPDYEYVLQEF